MVLGMLWAILGTASLVYAQSFYIYSPASSSSYYPAYLLRGPIIVQGTALSASDTITVSVSANGDPSSYITATLDPDTLDWIATFAPFPSNDETPYPYPPAGTYSISANDGGEDNPSITVNVDEANPTFNVQSTYIQTESISIDAQVASPGYNDYDAPALWKLTQPTGELVDSLTTTVTEQTVGTYQITTDGKLQNGTVLAAGNYILELVVAGTTQTGTFEVLPVITYTNPSNENSDVLAGFVATGVSSDLGGTVYISLYYANDPNNGYGPRSSSVDASTGAWSVDYSDLQPASYTIYASSSSIVGNTGVRRDVTIFLPEVLIGGDPPGNYPQSANLTVFSAFPQNSDLNVPLTRATWKLLYGISTIDSYTASIAQNATAEIEPWTFNSYSAPRDVGQYRITLTIGTYTTNPISFSLNPPLSTTIDKPSDGSGVLFGKVQFSGQGQSGYTVQLSFSSINRSASALVDNFGSWTYTYGNTEEDLIPAGLYTVSASNFNSIPTQSSYNFIDPSLTINGVTAGQAIAQSTTIVVSSIFSQNSQFTIPFTAAEWNLFGDNGHLIGSSPASISTVNNVANTVASYTVSSVSTTTLAIGSYSISLSLIDPRSSATVYTTVPVSFSIRGVATTQIDTPADISTILAGSVMVSGTGEPGQTITVKIASTGQSQQPTIQNDTSWSTSFDSVPAGTSQITASNFGAADTVISATFVDPITEILGIDANDQLPVDSLISVSAHFVKNSQLTTPYTSATWLLFDGNGGQVEASPATVANNGTVAVYVISDPNGTTRDVGNYFVALQVGSFQTAEIPFAIIPPVETTITFPSDGYVGYPGALTVAGGGKTSDNITLSVENFPNLTVVIPVSANMYWDYFYPQLLPGQYTIVASSEGQANKSISITLIDPQIVMTGVTDGEYYLLNETVVISATFSNNNDLTSPSLQAQWKLLMGSQLIDSATVGIARDTGEIPAFTVNDPANPRYSSKNYNLVLDLFGYTTPPINFALLDNPPPPPTIITSPANESVALVGSISVAGTGEPGTTIDVALTSRWRNSTTVSEDGRWETTVMQTPYEANVNYPLIATPSNGDPQYMILITLIDPLLALSVNENRTRQDQLVQVISPPFIANTQLTVPFNSAFYTLFNRSTLDTIATQIVEIDPSDNSIPPYTVSDPRAPRIAGGYGVGLQIGGYNAYSVVFDTFAFPQTIVDVPLPDSTILSGNIYVAGIAAINSTITVSIPGTTKTLDIGYTTEYTTDYWETVFDGLSAGEVTFTVTSLYQDDLIIPVTLIDPLLEISPVPTQINQNEQLQVSANFTNNNLLTAPYENATWTLFLGESLTPLLSTIAFITNERIGNFSMNTPEQPLEAGGPYSIFLALGNYTIEAGLFEVAASTPSVSRMRRMKRSRILRRRRLTY